MKDFFKNFFNFKFLQKSEENTSNQEVSVTMAEAETTVIVENIETSDCDYRCQRPSFLTKNDGRRLCS